MLDLLGAIVLLALWIVFGFVHPIDTATARPLGGGAAHLLYALAVILLVRWIALRDGGAATAENRRGPRGV
jgi:ABC-type transport system involved in cytochrome c biogenesis permease subunit